MTPRTQFSKSLEELYEFKPMVQDEITDSYRDMNRNTISHNKVNNTIRVVAPERLKNQIVDFARSQNIYSADM